MSSQTKPDVGNVIWNDTTHLSPVNVRSAWELQPGDRVFDRLGVEWDVIELERGKPTHCIFVRMRQVHDAANEGYITCTSTDKFLLSVEGVITP